MLEKEVEISNKLGLHLRAATKLVQLASEFEAEITVSCNDQAADAKSIMDVLMLAAIIGTIVTISVSGEYEEEERDILIRIATLFEERFGEDE